MAKFPGTVVGDSIREQGGKGGVNVGRVDARATVDINTELTVFYVNLRRESSAAAAQNQPFAFHTWVEKEKNSAFLIREHARSDWEIGTPHGM